MIEEFEYDLQEKHIKLLIDVRGQPYDRSHGFKVPELRENLTMLGIDYLHFGLLANPKHNRAAFAETEDGKQWYRTHIYDQLPINDRVFMLDQVSQHKNVGVMCFCRDHYECHRKVLLDELRSLRNYSELELWGYGELNL